MHHDFFLHTYIHTYSQQSSTASLPLSLFIHHLHSTIGYTHFHHASHPLFICASIYFTCSSLLPALASSFSLLLISWPSSPIHPSIDTRTLAYMNTYIRLCLSSRRLIHPSHHDQLRTYWPCMFTLSVLRGFLISLVSRSPLDCLVFLRTPFSTPLPPSISPHGVVRTSHFISSRFISSHFSLST